MATESGTMHGQQSDAPNILLVCVDQWRRDCLGIDGHPVVETPYLDELALNGVRFRRAYAATPTCIPARASLLTGLNQHRTGRIGYQDGVPWNYPVTIASEFTNAGYQTEAIGKLHVYPERSQMGFQHVQLHDGFLHFERNADRNYDRLDDYTPWLQKELGHGVDYIDHGVDVNGVTARPWDKPEYTHPSTWIASRAIDFFRRRDTRKPFFLYLGFHRPHPPYDPPAWAFNQYAGQSMPDPEIGDWVSILDPYRNDALHESHVAVYPRKVIDRAKAGYYGHMTHIDQQINRVLEHLRQYGQHRNTWICFVADHGEMMGDHHLYRKGYPYEASAGVPLVLAGPPGSGVPAGSTCDAVVELRDIMPTLLDCAGIRSPAGLDGASLLPLTRGECQTVRDWLHGEHLLFGQTVQWLTNGREKYVWWSGDGHEQLFDLAHDPGELHDLATLPELAATLAQWRSLLVEVLHGREDGHSDGTRLVSGRPVSPTLPSVLDAFAQRQNQGRTHA